MFFLHSGPRQCTNFQKYVGFRARVLSNRGPFGDDIGVDNIEMKCENGEIHDAVKGFYYTEQVS